MRIHPCARLPAALACASLLAACASPLNTLYPWGSYEDQVYAFYNASEKSSPQEQIAKLEADVEKARAAGKPLAPGHFAHLGLLYYQVGMIDKAAAAFETEKTVYPESSAFMKRSIAALSKGGDR